MPLVILREMVKILKLLNIYRHCAKKFSALPYSISIKVFQDSNYFYIHYADEETDINKVSNLFNVYNQYVFNKHWLFLKVMA